MPFLVNNAFFKTKSSTSNAVLQLVMKPKSVMTPQLWWQTHFM